jgi:hypothetical protein
MMRYTNTQESEVVFPLTFPPQVITTYSEDPETNYYFIGRLRGVVVSFHNSELILDDWLKFQSLLKQWRAERGVSSSITEGVLCLAYQGIVGMGERAIRLIITQLHTEGNDPDQWFWALQAITGKNPAKPEDQGDFRKMAQAWLEWAESEGYAG